MDFKYFFTNEVEIEAQGLNIGFELYSFGHFVWLAFILLAGIIISSWYKRQDEYKRSNIRKFFAIAILVFEIYRDAVLAFTGHFGWGSLPFHLCGLAIFVILIDAFFSKQELTRNMISFAFMPGAVAALLFCNWTAYPYLNFMNIHSFVFHGWIFFYFLMRYRAGEIRPSYRNLWKTIICLMILVYPMYTLNKAVGTNFMFLNEASEGSPLVPLWNIFGVAYGHLGYILSVIALVAIVLHVLYVVYKLLDVRKNRG